MNWSSELPIRFSTKLYIESHTPIGIFQIRLNRYAIYLNDSFIIHCENLDEAKQYCYQYLLNKYNLLAEFLKL